jgi:dCTP diphosphatase
MNDDDSTLSELKARTRQFSDERDWQQFHDLKNLSMAIAIEAAELMEHFRWIGNTEANALMSNTAVAAEIREEVADILLLVAQFANVADIDLMDSAAKKLVVNAARYPVAEFKGSATKYNKR